MIQYDDIDPEIRTLVCLMNKIPGVCTRFSCVGHKENEEGYISFEVASQSALLSVLEALPAPAFRSFLVANRLEWESSFVDVSLLADTTICYRLRIGGYPQYAQRRLIAKIEKGLICAGARKSGR